MQTYWNISRKRMRRRWWKRWTETEGGKDGAKESGRKKKKQEYKAQYIIMPLAIAKAPQACLKFHLFCYDRCQNSDPWEWRALFCPKISIIRERAGQISLNSCLFQPWFDLLHSLQCQSRDFLKLSDKDPPLYRPWRPLGHVLTHWEMKEMTEKVVGRGGAPRWAVVCCIEPNNPPDAFCFKARDVICCFRLHSGTPADSRQVAMRSEWPSPPQALLRLLRKSQKLTTYSMEPQCGNPQSCRRCCPTSEMYPRFSVTVRCVNGTLFISHCFVIGYVCDLQNLCIYQHCPDQSQRTGTGSPYKYILLSKNPICQTAYRN